MEEWGGGGRTAAPPQGAPHPSQAQPAPAPSPRTRVGTAPGPAKSGRDPRAGLGPEPPNGGWCWWPGLARGVKSLPQVRSDTALPPPGAKSSPSPAAVGPPARGSSGGAALGAPGRDGGQVAAPQLVAWVSPERDG